MPELKPRDVSEEAATTLIEQLDTLLDDMSGEEVLVTLQSLRDAVANRMDDITDMLLYGEDDAHMPPNEEA